MEEVQYNDCSGMLLKYKYIKKVILIYAIAIFEVLKYTITIRLFRKLPL